MASSGTINGNQSGTQPYLRISWSILSQDIPNNRSRVRLQLILVSTHSLHFSASKTGSNNGSSFTYTGGFSGTGTRTLNTRDIWVNHNSDGTRTQSVNGSFNIQINWQGSHLSSLSVSGSMNLDTIPRSSEVTAFSMGSALQISTANSVSVRLNVYSTAFRFDVTLRYGSTTIASWNNQSFTHNTSRSLSLSTAQVNDLLSAMRSTSSGTVTIRVQTKSGSGGSNIGSLQTRNATVSIHSSVTPNATGLSVSIRGSGRDSSINKYVQSISRVNASFTASATGGATISSTSIVVRENSSKGNSMTINGTSGNTGVLTRSGTYEAIATVRDTRGRETTQRVTFTVHAYEAPRITTFTADRNSSTPTTVNIRRSGDFTSLGGDNTLTIQVQRRISGGSWTNVVSNVTTNSGTFDAGVTSTGNDILSSYEFRAYIVDSFNNESEATATVTTQRVVLDVHKNEGVGIGKIHEKGVLDVDGEAHFSGDLFVNGTNVSRLVSFSNAEGIPTPVEDTSTFWQTLPQGSYFVGTGQIPNQPSNWGVMVHTTQNMGTGSDFTTMWYTQASGRIYRKSGNRTQNTDWIQIDSSSGTNSNGTWVRFGDGIQICSIRDIRLQYDTTQRLTATWTFPMSFPVTDNLVTVASRRSNHGSAYQIYSHVGASPNDGTGATIRMYRESVNYSSGNAELVNVIAIGRWR